MKDSELSLRNREALRKVMQMLGVRSFNALAKKLCFDTGNFTRISTGERTITDRLLWRVAILTDKKPRQLLKELGLSVDCSFEYFHKDRKPIMREKDESKKS